jgi:hypothetical protein
VSGSGFFGPAGSGTMDFVFDGFLKMILKKKREGMAREGSIDLAFIFLSCFEIHVWL